MPVRSRSRSPQKGQNAKYFETTLLQGGEDTDLEGGGQFLKMRFNPFYWDASISEAFNRLITNQPQLKDYLSDFLFKQGKGAPPVVVKTYWRKATTVRAERGYIEIALGSLTPLSNKLVVEIVVNRHFPFSEERPYYKLYYTMEPVFPLIQQQYVKLNLGRGGFQVMSTDNGVYSHALTEALTFLRINGVIEQELVRVNKGGDYAVPLYTSSCESTVVNAKIFRGNVPLNPVNQGVPLRRFL